MIIFTVITNMLLGAIPAVGFALVFNVPVKALKYCALGGAIVIGVRTVLMANNMPIEWATFMAAIVIGMIGVYWSHRFLAHPKVFTVAAVIPMIPGKFAFTAMIALVEIKHNGFDEQLFALMMDNFLQAIFIISGLAIGLALPGLLFYRRRSIV